MHAPHTDTLSPHHRVLPVDSPSSRRAASGHMTDLMLETPQGWGVEEAVLPTELHAPNS